MKFSKPVTTLVCLLTSTSVFAAEAAKVVAPIAHAAAKNPAPAPKPLPTTLKISAINGVKNPNHNKTILRNPNQEIRFSADLFVNQKGKLLPQNSDPRDFIWELDNRPACDSARPASCADAGIELTQEGIAFTLPEDFETMKLKVSSVDGKKSDKISISNKVVAEQRAAEERERAEEARLQAEQEQAEQAERNRAILGAVFGAVVGGLSAYGEYKANEQREQRREEHRREWEQRRNNPPQSPVITPAPQPQPPSQPSNPHGGGGGFQGHGGGDAHGPRGQH